MRRSVMSPAGLRTLRLLARRDSRRLDETTLSRHREYAAAAPRSWVGWVLEQAIGDPQASQRPWGPEEIVLLSYALDVDAEHVDWLRERGEE